MQDISPTRRCGCQFGDIGNRWESWDSVLIGH